jgi:hypothetical protein
MDRAGHMALLGFVGWNSPDGFYQKCEFGFAFDTGWVNNLIREFARLEGQRTLVPQLPSVDCQHLATMLPSSPSLGWRYGARTSPGELVRS